MALTSLQEGMLFHYLKDPAGDFYFGQLSLGISGHVDISLFEQAWNIVTAGNEMLRTVFRWEKMSNPTQVVLKTHSPRLNYYDFFGGNPGEEGEREAEDRLEELKIRDRKETFDLKEVPFRVTLYRITENEYELVISNHHILYDGWSTGIILEEFFNAYNDLTEGKVPALPAKTSFKEFVRRHQKLDVKKQEMFWREYLRGVDADNRTGVPVNRRYTRGSGEGDSRAETVRYTFRVTFNRGGEGQWADFVKAHKITPAALLYGAWGLLLQRCVNSDDVIFGTTVSGRSVQVEGIEEMVGLFINTVPLRFSAGPGQDEPRSVKDILVNLYNSLQTREAYENTPLVKIYQYCGCGPEVELFDSLVVVENYPLDVRRIRESGPLSVVSYSMVESTHYDLTVVIRLTDSIDVEFLYREEVFDAAVIRRLGTHFTSIVRGILENPRQDITGFEFLSHEEQRRILEDFNDTGVDYPRDNTLHGLFEQQAARIGDRVAVVGTTSITYRQLNEKSGRLAQLLRDKGVRQGDIAGIMMERSVEMVVGIFGILKAGAAYLPIDPGYPEERKQYILKDSNAKVLLSELSESSELSGGFPVGRRGAPCVHPAVPDRRLGRTWLGVCK
ncbi:MAG: AMP-binding protein [bacterium]|nr:AMP-binding protein [bacterium]